MQDLAPRMCVSLKDHVCQVWKLIHQSQQAGESRATQTGVIYCPQGYVGKGILLSTETVPHVSLDLTLQNHIDLVMKMFT